MRDVTYPDYGYESPWFCPPGYGELVDSFELDAVIEVHDDNYQGDSYYLFKDGNSYGILVFGWGSCSGCDALEACSSDAEVTELRNNLFNSIHWEHGFEAMRDYVATKNWEHEWYSYNDGGKRFTQEIKAYFGVDTASVTE